MDIVHHFSHEHPLKLRELFLEEGPPDLLFCGGCEHPIRGPTYCCEQCKFVLHKSCAEFPSEIRHPFHLEHLLTIFIREHWSQRSKGREVPRRTFAYRCCSQDCSFELEGVDAVATLPDKDFYEEKENGRETLRHISHEHPLTSLYVKGECNLECKGCGGRNLGEAYICYDCRFILHKECAELPQSVEHPFHTVHPLNLVPDPTGLSLCAACRKPSVLFYGCVECQYGLDVSCAMSTLATKSQRKEEGSVIKHLAHEHELASFHVNSEIKACCAFCSKSLSRGEVCGCPRCGFFLHESCAQESAQFEHPFHPEHQITLVKCPKSDETFMDFCSFCLGGSSGYDDYHFSCQQCTFKLDPVCCLESLAYFKGGGGMEIKHFLHDHPLRIGKGPFKSCKICKDKTNGPSYSCNSSRCNFWLHKSCAELPSVMEHSFHPQHRLVRNPEEVHDVFTCSACNLKSNTLAFSCATCSFYLDASCALQMPVFKHPLHEHKLSYFKESEQLKCNACDDYCNLDLYRCVQCNFNLHRTCVELPQSVEHKRHWHPLTLYDKYLEDDTGEYYCEICETRRHPDRGVYCCMKCEFFAHIECVLVERKLIMKDDLALKEIDDEIAGLEAAIEEKKEELEEIRRKLEGLERKRESVIELPK